MIKVDELVCRCIERDLHQWIHQRVYYVPWFQVHEAVEEPVEIAVHGGDLFDNILVTQIEAQMKQDLGELDV